MPEAKTRVFPSAIPPSETELQDWNVLSREEQARRYEEALAHPDCATASNDTMSDLRAEAQARLAADRE